jgi:hypothetical protein
MTNGPPTTRCRLVQAISGWLAVGNIGWASVLIVTGGFDTRILGVSLSSHEPLRPLLIAAIAALIYVFAEGTIPIGVAVFDWIDRWRQILVAALLTWFLLLLFVKANARPLWHDEIVTVLVSTLPVATMWQACMDGVDLAPPLNAIVTRVIHGLTGVGPVATRLPAIIGFLVAAALLFAMVRRRTSALIGLAAAVLLFQTFGWRYGIEARGYSLGLGLFTVALYGWSESAAGRRRFTNWSLMAVALGAGLWTHYYLILAFLPILVGELVRQSLGRRFDPWPWLAMGAGGLLAMPLWPLVSAASTQRATFWARGEPLVDTYWFLLAPLFSFRWVFIVVAILAIAELARRTRRRSWGRTLPAHEVAAFLACLALPAAAVGTAELVSVFTARYALFALSGMVLGFVVLARMLMPRTTGIDAIAAFGALALLVTNTREIASNPPVWRDPLETRPTLVQSVNDPGPLAISGSFHYLEIWYYLPEQQRDRLIYLADLPGLRRESIGDTTDRGFLAMGRWFPTRVAELDAFTREQRDFRLYLLQPGAVDRSLELQGGTLTFRGREPDGGGSLYTVSLPGTLRK